MNVKFVSHKISRIRWEPIPENSLENAEIFCTGSWDNSPLPSNVQSCFDRLYNLLKSKLHTEYETGFILLHLSYAEKRAPAQNMYVYYADHVLPQSMVNSVSIWQLLPVDKNHPSEAADNEPVLQCNAKHNGDIMDLVFLMDSNREPTTVDVSIGETNGIRFSQWTSGEHVAVASSVGSVLLFKHDRDRVTLTEISSWNHIHHHPREGAPRCPSTFVTSSGGDIIVSGGEDGRMNVLDVESGMLSRVIDGADSCTMNDGIFTKQEEVVTVNSIGQLKVWDLRSSSDKYSRIFSLTNDRTPVNCIDQHPSQPHILATGTQDGSLCIWDMRKDDFPVTIMEAHQADMWDVQFHRTYPDNLFSCSEDGSVWHWDGSGISAPVSYSTTPGDLSKKARSDATNPWLASEASKHRMDITNLITENTMPVNTLSVDGTTLLCGSDGEAIFTIPSLPIR